MPTATDPWIRRLLVIGRVWGYQLTLSRLRLSLHFSCRMHSRSAETRLHLCESYHAFIRISGKIDVTEFASFTCSAEDGNADLNSEKTRPF